ncbi:MAG: hypothetical protein AB2L18_03740 [Anaerolineaceae bacterium]
MSEKVKKGIVVYDKKFLIAEYSALSSYFNQVINFRFLTFGFFIAVIGIINFDRCVEGRNNNIELIIIGLTMVVWLLELRNRSLSETLSKRGKEIEEVFDKFNLQHNNQFFHRMDEGEKHGGKTKIFGCTIRNIKILGGEKEYKYYLISHSFAFDIAYFLAILISIISLAVL